MTNIYKTYLKSVLLWLMLMVTVLSFGQQSAIYNRKGERQGVVRIKVTKTAGHLLKQAPANSNGALLSTGISSFDAVSNRSKATRMKRLFPESPDPKIEAKLRKHGLDLWYEVEIDGSQDAAAIAHKYEAIDEVVIAEAERLKVVSYGSAYEHLKTTPAQPFDGPFNDPYLGDQWHYDNTGQSGYPEGKDVNLFAAWQVTAGSSNVIVSVHDEGVDVNHEDLAENMWVNLAELNGTPEVDDDGNGYIDDIHGWNFTNNSAVIDADTHGTHVAGTIAAVNNNAKGVSGVAGGTGNNDGAKIMSLKIIGGSGSAAGSFVYAANNGAVISQNSWGYTSPGSTEQAVRDAMNYFIAEAGDYAGSPMRGGIIIFAAGNADSDAEWYPGFYPEAFTVSAVGPEGIRAGYSNYGSWVDIAAPGGDMQLYGVSNGVLSTLPGDKIGYLDGTSMACPHVSGIGALALANSPVQITPEILMNKLLTGTQNIDQLNPNYIGKLGQLTDAFLAIQNDEGIAPETITDLVVDGIAQEFANLSFTVPADTDDTTPYGFEVYYTDQELSAENLEAANKIEIQNTQSVGETVNVTIENLLGLTTYNFAVVAVDRWGNTSVLSNVVTETTNAGPKINVDANSLAINVDIDAAVSTMGTHDMSILNEAEGVLRWDYEVRHVNTLLAYGNQQPAYPTGKTKTPEQANVIVKELPGAKSLADAIPSPMNFEPNKMEYFWYVSDIIGEEDTDIPNSSATKFMVDSEEGFNLTDVRGYLKHDPALGPVIVEIYKNDLNRNSLIASQEYSSWGTDEHTAYIKLNEQLYFENGESFWVVFHVPSGNQYPLGIGPKNDINDTSDANCYISFDMGNSWGLLSEAINNKDYVWAVTAVTNHERLGTYITLDPASGEIAGNDEAMVQMSVNAENLINGTYNSNLLLHSNDGNQPEYRVPVSVNVFNQKAILSAVSELNFGSVFQGESKEISFVLTNIGLANYKDISVTSSNPQFEIVGYAPWQIAAKANTTVTIKYTPSANTGNDNGLLKISSASSDAFADIVLFGVSTEPGKIKVTPLEQTIDDITIGDEITANITIENEGASALKYFIPGFDTAGISTNWPYEYSETGYKFRSSDATESTPITYAYEDISASGTSLTQYFKDDKNRYMPVDMGFNFPYFKKNVNQLFVAASGFTTFDDSVNPINLPSLNGAPWTPKGYISVLGTFTDLVQGGDIYYEVKADRVIVQYDNLTDGWSGVVSAQMVLHKTGDIRFYYNNITYSEDALNYLNVLIEDIDQTDGILYRNWEVKNEIYSGLAIGYDYPGPDIISSISNGSGTLLPGSSADLEIKMDASTLVEGSFNRYINIISNDPFKRQEHALIQLNVTSGGVANVSLSATELDFGTVFQGATTLKQFMLNNEGTALSNIGSFEQSTDSFIVNGDTNGTIEPGSRLVFDVIMPTDVVGELSDVITIKDNNDNEYTVTLTGTVIDPPAISMDLSLLDETLIYGETSAHEFTITNTGLADLEVVATGTEWASMGEVISTNDEIPNFSYSLETYNQGENYQWLDIRPTGKKLPFAEDVFNVDDFYRTVELESPIKFYGQEFSTIYIAENGMITFEKPNEIILFPDNVPTDLVDGLIAPFWAFAGFNTFLYPESQIGMFLLEDDEKTVISWEFLVDNFGGLGDPVSAQVIFYRNGTLKFQYKVNGGLDLSSGTSVIGIQSPDKSDRLLISNRVILNHGQGLAYVLVPAEKQVIAPGETLTTNINFDAGSVYGGFYSGELKFRTNVPNQEALVKPVSLTVIGEAILQSSRESIDYGDVMIYDTPEGPKTYMADFDVTNLGSAPVNLSGLAMENMQGEYTIELYTYDSWFNSYYWQNVAWLWQWPTLQPNESAKFRITYAPQTVGEILNNAIVSSNTDDLVIPVTANVTLPPVLGVDTESIYSQINEIDGTDTQIGTFNNTNGSGVLAYELSIDYLRSEISTSSTRASESTASFADFKNLALFTSQGSNDNYLSMGTYGNYNASLAHDTKELPDTFIGFGGASDFIAGTRFNAGPNGFTLSHVETFIRASELLAGSIAYEIRAGGTSIADATILGEGSVSYDLSQGATDALITLALNEQYNIYPNEDFYVILKYPFELSFPQGVVFDVEDAPGRFTTIDSGNWFDLQEVYAGNGWMVRAHEETHKSNSWLQVDELATTSVEAGMSQDISLNFFAEFAQRGDQHAKLIIKTNDPINSVGEIPVTLHVNEAPTMTGNPELIVINEGEVSLDNLVVSDAEGHAFTVLIDNAPSWLSYEIVDSEVKLSSAPDYESAGVYELDITITDTYDAAFKTTITIEVMDTNRAPEAISFDDLAYAELNIYDTVAFDQYFMDPDGDEISYQVTVADNSIVTLFTSADSFLLQTKAFGETTLNITATDAKGATMQLELKVIVSSTLSTDDHELLGLKFYPNPAKHVLNVSSEKQLKSLEIYSISGQMILKKSLSVGNRAALDVSSLSSGIYFVKANSEFGTASFKFIKE